MVALGRRVCHRRLESHCASLSRRCPVQACGDPMAASFSCNRPLRSARSEVIWPRSEHGLTSSRLLRPAAGQPVALARAPSPSPAVLAAVKGFLALAARHRPKEDGWVSTPRRPCSATAAAPAARGIGERLRFYRDAAEHACPGRQGKSVPLNQPVPAGDLQFACLRAGALVGALRDRRYGAFASCAIAEGLPVRGVLVAGTTFDVGHSAAGRGAEPVTLTELDLHRLPADSAGFPDWILLGNAATSGAVDGHDAERAGDREFGAAPLALDGVERLP
ncbi:hypothetical protein YUYDRAFT_02786 [Streptomyces sp. ScaeMP-e48]|nr:hypothetical protein YUYDRAFT_02786 [Streptomyces sp. ScaeMP-e48]